MIFEKETANWISFVPKEDMIIYPCYACRDMFSSKSSFLDHINRRSMLLSYKCSACPNMCYLKFYNPCTFLLHTRLHYGPQNGKIDLMDLHITTLSWDMIGFDLHPDISREYDVEEEYAVNDDINTKFYNPLIQSSGQRYVVMSPIILMFYHRKTAEKIPMPLVLKQLCKNIPLCKFVTFGANVNSQSQVIKGVEDMLCNVRNYDINDVSNSNTTITTSTTTTVTTNLNKITNIPTTKNVLLINNCQQNTKPTNIINNNTVSASVTTNLNKITNIPTTKNVLLINNCQQISKPTNIINNNTVSVSVTTNLNKTTNIPPTRSILLINSCKQNSKLTNINNNTVSATVTTNLNKTINIPTTRNVLLINNLKQNSKTSSIKNTLHVNNHKPDSKLVNIVNYVHLKDGIIVTQTPHTNGNSANEGLAAHNEPNDSTLLNPTISCPECNEIQMSTMKIHFASKDSVPRHRTWQCGECSYIASSKCSLTAHERIHKGDPPHVCPECGKTFPKFLQLLDHLDDVCFHLAKQVRFRCPKKNCCKIFAQKGTFFEHFRTHVQVQHVCKICYKPFCTLKDFKEHSSEIHGTTINPTIIFKCTVCRSNNSVIKDNNTLTHVEWHCSDTSLCVYVYVCKYCRNYCRSVTSYAFHILRCMKKYSKEWWKVKRSNTCTICPNTNCNYIIRMITSMERCPKCEEVFVLKRNPELQPDAVVEVCLGTDSFPDKTPTCILCNEKLETELDKDHQCAYAHPIVVLGKFSHNDNGQNKSPGGLSNSIDPVRRKRKKHSLSPNSSIKLKRTSSEIEIEPELEEPKSFEGTYCCKNCQFSTENRQTFHEHVIEHRDVSTSYQCMECGECFMVKPSLHKHLLYYHQVKDFDNYVEENNCYSKEALAELREAVQLPLLSTNKVEPNQCRVCLQKFSEDHELSKHFRSHGMAFLLKNGK